MRGTVRMPKVRLTCGSDAPESMAGEDASLGQNLAKKAQATCKTFAIVREAKEAVRWVD